VVLRRLLVVSVLGVLLLPATATAQATHSRTGGTPAGLYDWDPLRLIAVDAVRSHTLGVDVIEVWACDGPGGASLGADDLTWAVRDSGIVEYFRWWSNGRYEPRFVPGGWVGTSDPSACRSAVFDRSPGTSSGALLVLDYSSGGNAYPGRYACSTSPYDCDLAGTFPVNGRYAVVGMNFVVGSGVEGKGPAGLLHELGHLLAWPHSFTGRGDEYDNPVDVMSGLGALGTLAVNRYAAGWIDPSAVTIAAPSGTTAVIGPHGSGRDELLVVPTTELGRYYAVDVRRATSHDWMDGRAEGVQVHLVDQGSGACAHPPIVGFPCFGGTRRTSPYPATGGFDHVLSPGERLQLPGGTGLAWTLEVLGAAGGGFELRVTTQLVPLCAGLPATLVGTTGPDVLVGTSGPDVIVALDGDDVVRGGGGDDIVCAGDGDDRVLGGPGDDHLVGAAGNDQLLGGPGADLLDGGDGNDVVRGLAGTDTLYGGEGGDRVFGGTDPDTAFGGPGDDVLKGGAGDDLLDGGEGYDELYGGGGADTCRAAGVSRHC
jgi:hypothetical protein